jgi:hypothetical protein
LVTLDSLELEEGYDVVTVIGSADCETGTVGGAVCVLEIVGGVRVVPGQEGVRVVCRGSLRKVDKKLSFG